MALKDRPESLLSFIIGQVQGDIARGKYPPSTRLSPNSLATEYGVSHIPVREALSSLAAKGYIVHHQSRGFFTRELTEDELRDIDHWRRVLETEAFRMAVPQLTADDLKAMRTAANAMRKLTRTEDRLDYLQLNREFHFVVFRRAESPLLLRLLDYLWDISASYGAVEVVDHERGYRDHLAQLEFIEAGKVERLIKAMDDHRNHRLASVSTATAAL